MGIGRTLADILREKNIKVTDLAKNIGVAPTTIYSIIDRDNMKIDISVLIKICNYLNVDINLFYKDYLNNNIIKEKSNHLTAEEINLLNMFRNIDDYGKKAIDAILKVEYTRCKEESQKRYQNEKSNIINSNQNIPITYEEPPPPRYSYQYAARGSNWQGQTMELSDEEVEDLLKNSKKVPRDL